MRKDRRIQILGGLLIAQIILLTIVYWPRPAQATAAPMFPDLTTADVSRLTLADNEGKAITLAKQGEAWVLPDAGDYPAKAESVTGLIDKLLKLKTNRLIAETPASQDRLQVAEGHFMRRIDFETTKGGKHTVYLGTSPRAGAVHFRLQGQDKVYLTNSLATYEANVDAASYIDTSYISIPAADVTALTIQNDKGAIEFTRDAAAESAWKLAGLSSDQTLDAAAVQTLLNRVTALALATPLSKTPDPAWGLDNPQATVTLTTKDGKSVELGIGAKDEAANQYYAKSSASPYFVKVAAFSLDDFVSKAAADFVATPTPPAEAPAPQ